MSDTVGVNGPPSPTDAKANEPKLEGAALIDALRVQLEFYFSRQNLATDAFLLAQMNAHPNKSVPIDVLANFRKIKSLTEDRAVLIQALKQCKNLALDEKQTLVRSNIKVERSTLILRDMQADSSESELRAVFEGRDGSLCKGKIVSLTPEVNDTWFLTFDSESTCMDVLMDIQEKAGTPAAYQYRNKAIHARVKNESLTRSFYTGPTSSNTPPPTIVNGGSIMTGGPVGPNAGQYNPYHMHATHGGYYYPPYPMQYGPPAQFMPPMQIGTPVQMPQQIGVPTVTPAQPTQTPSKAEKKQQAAALQAQQLAAAQEKKAKKAAAAAAASANTAAAPAADGTTAATPGKKAKKAKAKADAAAAAAATSVPVVEDKSHLTKLYGHVPRTYSREQIASIVDSYIRSPSSKLPEGLTNGQDPEHLILKTQPSNSYLILDTFPVFYPASPTIALAAQSHHSSSLPFLELGGAMESAPFFNATGDQGFAGAVAAGATQQRRKSKSGESGQAPNAAAKKTFPKAGGAPVQATRSPAIKPRAAPSPQSTAPQPKIIPPPAIQPPSAAAGAKPTSFAAAALAAGNAPAQQPIKPVVKPAATPATTKPIATATTGPNKDAKDAPKKEKQPKKKPAAAAAATTVTATTNGTPATAAATKPVTPVVNYASRVGAISPAEAQAKANALKQAKEAKDAAAAAAKGESPSATKSVSPPTANASSQQHQQNKSNPSATPSSDSTVTSPASGEAKASTFSYAAMIKKAPAPSSSTPAATAPTKRVDATVAASASKDNNNSSPAPVNVTSPLSGSIKSDAGNWRAQAAQ